MQVNMDRYSALVAKRGYRNGVRERIINRKMETHTHARVHREIKRTERDRDLERV